MMSSLEKKREQRRANLKKMFEHVIRNPFDMKPVFNTCEKPVFNANETDLEIQSQRKLELDNLGSNIWFETDVAVEEKLVREDSCKIIIV